MITTTLKQKLDGVSRYRHTYIEGWKGGSIKTLGDILIGVLDHPNIKSVRYVFRDVHLTSSKVKTGDLYYWRPTNIPIPVGLLYDDDVKVYVSIKGDRIPISLEWYTFEDKERLKKIINIEGIFLFDVDVTFNYQKPEAYKSINSSEYQRLYMWRIINGRLNVTSV